MKHLGTFTGKMNMDVSDVLIPTEDYTYALNFTNNDKEVSSVGVGGRIRSNNLVTNDYLEDNDTVVGRAVYEKRNGEIVFVKNTVSSKHKILLLLYANDQTYTLSETHLLIKGDWLNFPNVVDSKCYEDNIVFTDDSNEPRMFNIQWMYNYNKQTLNSGQTLKYFEEIQGSTYPDVGSTYFDYFIYQDAVYKLIMIGGSGDFVIVEPPNSHYVRLQDFNDETYYNISEKDLLFIAAPPIAPAGVTYFYDEDIKTNNVYGNVFVVTYRYIYLDGRKSVWSAYSNMNPPLGQTTEDGYKLDGALNGVSINIPAPGFEYARNLKGIDVAVKNLSDSSTFKIIKTLRNDSPLDLINGNIFNFYNNESYLALELSDTLRQFDYVPYKSGNLDILSDGRVLFGDLEEGYEGIAPNVNLEIVEDTVNIDPTTHTFVKTTDVFDGISYTIYSWDTSTFKLGMEYSVNYSYTITIGAYGSKTYSHNAFISGQSYNWISSNTAKFLRMMREITARIREDILIDIKSYITDITGPSDINRVKATTSSFNIKYGDKADSLFVGAQDNAMFAVTTTDSDGIEAANISSFITADTLEVDVWTSVYVEAYTAIVSSLAVSTATPMTLVEPSDVEVATVKSNSTIELGIRYYDGNMRPSTVIPIGNVNTDFLDLETIDSTHLDIKYNQIKATIGHAPPDYAKYYSFVVMRGISYDFYVQLVAANVDNTGTYTTIDPSKIITDTVTLNDNLLLSPYIFEKGDRIRFLADLNSSVGTLDYTYAEGFDLEILKQDSSTGIISFVKQASLIPGDIIEIYRPRKVMEDEESELYFEVDTIRKVQGGFHVGNDQTQSSSQPAIITLDYNNAYIRKRMSYYIGGTNVTYHYFIESDTFSDWYKSEFNGYGRPAIVIDVVTDQSTMLRFGGKLLPEAANNFIAKFDWEDYNVLSRMFGTINGMRLVGDTIVVFQDTKVTSFYINKTAIKEADGGQQTILTDKVLNNKMVSEFDFGCINSQSIVKRDTHVLFFDAINGNFVRHSKNGMIDISAYGVSEFSKELGNAVQSGVVDLKGAYNERNDYFYWLINFTPLALPYPIPFPDPTPEINAKNARWKALFENGDNGLAIIFDNKANAWKGFVEMNNSSGNAEMIGRTNSFLTTYIDGQPYVFDSNSFGKTFGIYRETVVEKVINVQPLEVKIFNHLEVNAEDTWLPSETGDVTTDYGHSSRIRFMKEKEGHFYNDIKRNMLFPNGTLRANENLGEILRGNTCTIRLRLASDVAEDEQSTITSIGAGVTLSEKT